MRRDHLTDGDVSVATWLNIPLTDLGNPMRRHSSPPCSLLVESSVTAKNSYICIEKKYNWQIERNTFDELRGEYVWMWSVKGCDDGHDDDIYNYKDGDDDNYYGDDYINWDGDDCNYDQDIKLLAAVDFLIFSAVSQGWAWNINDFDDFHDSLNVVIMMMSYNEISDDGDDLGNIEELLPCHWILNGPKCW